MAKLGLRKLNRGALRVAHKTPSFAQIVSLGILAQNKKKNFSQVFVTTNDHTLRPHKRL
jgi:hypothetical protein